MNVFINWIHPLNHCEDAVYHLLKQARIKITRSSIRKQTTEHPDYPSLLSIIDVLKIHKVDSVAIRMDIDEWRGNISCPFLAHAKADKLDHDIFVVVNSVSELNIEIYNPEIQKTEKISRNEFAKKYKGVILAIDPTEDSGEKDYDIKSKGELYDWVSLVLAILIIPIVTLLSCVFGLVFSNNINQLHLILFELISLIGYFISIFLLWHEIDEYNPVLKQMCKTRKKVNCSAILNSSAAKIFGIHWSTIGFTYFAGMLMLLVIGGINHPGIIELLSFVNFAAVPFIFFSIYFQWRVLKQWCLLCMAVQVVLLLQLAININGGFYDTIKISTILPTDYLSVLSIFGFVLGVILFLMRSLKTGKNVLNTTRDLERLKRNPQIFEALLTKNNPINLPGNEITIKKGNPNGKYKLLKVCNPYCGPCAKAHVILEELIKYNEEVSVEIIFTATQFDYDHRREPVMHFLAIEQTENAEVTKRALDDWYNSTEKNYKGFAENYPIERSILSSQIGKIKQMRDWCDTVGVTSTPTFFLNGYKLPEMYSISDLKYFLSS